MIDASEQPKKPLLTTVKFHNPLTQRLLKTQIRALYGARKGKMWNRARTK